MTSSVTAGDMWQSGKENKSPVGDGGKKVNKWTTEADGQEDRWKGGVLCDKEESEKEEKARRNIQMKQKWTTFLE